MPNSCLEFQNLYGIWLGGAKFSGAPDPVWHQHLSRLAWASQDIHIGENCFLNLFWELNWPAQAFKQPSARFAGLPRWLKQVCLISRLASASQTSMAVKTVFSIFPGLKQACRIFTARQPSLKWHCIILCHSQLLNRLARASQDLNGSYSGFVGHFPHLNTLDELNRTSTKVKPAFSICLNRPIRASQVLCSS